MVTMEEADARLLESEYFRPFKERLAAGDTDMDTSWFDYRGRADRLAEAPIELTEAELAFHDAIAIRLPVVDAAWYDVGRIL
jgi:hypothetical protein